MGNNLKKGLFLLLAVFFAGFSASFVLAQGVTSSDLGVEQTGILPSNPFYFFKTWGRNIRQTFSFSELARAQLQLDILNEQAAEIRKLDELDVTEAEVFLKAVNNFEASVASLGARLSALKGIDGANQFVESFLDKVLKYQDVLDALAVKFENTEGVNELRASTLNSLNKLVDIVLVIPNNVVGIKKFTESFEVVALKQRGELREFRAVEFIDRLESKAPADLLGPLLKLKDSLLLKFSGRLQATKPGEVGFLNMLESSSADTLLRLKVIDEAREKINDPDLKNQVNIIRKRIFDKVRMKNLISEVTAKDELSLAQNKIDGIVSGLVEQPVGAFVNVAPLIERARFNFDEAKKFYEEESFSSAYGQALSASAAAENALSQILINNDDLSEELKNIKIYFDNLSGIAQKAKLDKANTFKISKEFSEIEKTIAYLADLIGDSKNSIQAHQIVRDLKGRMYLLGQMLDQAVSQD